MLTRFRSGSLTALLLVAMAGGCGLSGNDEPSGDPLDPDAAQEMLQRNFYTTIPLLTDGLARALASINGTPQPGVTFTAVPGGVQGTVAADLDGDGSMESSLSARIILHDPAAGVAGGAHVSITSIQAAAVSGTAETDIALVDANTLGYVDGSALLRSATGPRQLVISNANFTATLGYFNPVLSGSADFRAGITSGTVFFEPTGGGFRMRVTSPNFPSFTVP
jgi:hypothetical protein